MCVCFVYASVFVCLCVYRFMCMAQLLLQERISSQAWSVPSPNSCHSQLFYYPPQQKRDALPNLYPFRELHPGLNEVDTHGSVTSPSLGTFEQVVLAPVFSVG